jgi:hypothetical protein
MTRYVSAHRHLKLDECHFSRETSFLPCSCCHHHSASVLQLQLGRSERQLPSVVLCRVTRVRVSWLQVIIEGPQESAKQAQDRLVECMQQPFVKDRQQLQDLMQGSLPGLGSQELARWDACYHCGLRLPLSVDADTADTWYDAK